MNIYHVLEFGKLIKLKKITSLELTQIFIQRLKRYNPVLEAVVTYIRELANQQAKEADELLARGVYLGPLHGIPYGLKDIISVPHYKTTWRSKTFKDKVLDIETWVFKRLKSAGAILVAKLVTRTLAYDDIWFGGRTKNKWNIEEFTTGSSSGMVPFAIGSETVASMTLPAAHCGVAALCAIFASVGRTRIMSLLESLRHPFEDPFSVDITRLTVGYVNDVDMKVIHVLESKSINMVPFKLNYIVDFVQCIVNFTMDVDMLSHFDEWQRSRKYDDYESQANVDWERICMGNLVGMPVIVVPARFTNILGPPRSDCSRRTAMTIGIYAPPHRDHIALALTMAYQFVTT
ncbi:hypothetical protein ACFX2J_038408 [Malus domestica]